MLLEIIEFYNEELYNNHHAKYEEGVTNALEWTTRPFKNLDVLNGLQQHDGLFYYNNEVKRFVNLIFDMLFCLFV